MYMSLITGEFGVIYKANYYSQDGVTVVAVKTLKGKHNHLIS